MGKQQEINTKMLEIVELLNDIKAIILEMTHEYERELREL